MNGVDVTSVQHDDAVKLLTCGVGQIVLDVRRCCPASPGVASDASDTSELEIVDLTLPYLNSLGLTDPPGPQFRLEGFMIAGDQLSKSAPAPSGDRFVSAVSSTTTQSSSDKVVGEPPSSGQTGVDVAATPKEPGCPGQEDEEEEEEATARRKDGASEAAAAPSKESSSVLRRQASSSLEGSGSFRRGILRRLLPAEDDRTPSPPPPEDLYYENRFLFSSSQRTGELRGGGGDNHDGLACYLAGEDGDSGGGGARYRVISRLIQDDIVRTIQPL